MNRKKIVVITLSHRALQNDLSATLRFDLNDYWVFKVEGHRVDGTGDVVAVDNLVDSIENDYSKDIWYYGAAKITFSFRSRIFLNILWKPYPCLRNSAFSGLPRF